MIAALLSLLPGVSTLVSLLTPARAAALDNLGRLDTPLAAGLANTGKSRAVVFNSSGTWTRPAGVTAAYVILVGGGGGSGGNNYGSSNWSGGGGGGEVKFGWVPVSGDVYVTIGAGGAAGPATPGSGGNGGTSQFATLYAQGGYGGGACTDSTNGIGGTGGGVATGGAGNGGNGATSPTSCGGGGGSGKSIVVAGSCPGYGGGVSRGGGASWGNSVSEGTSPGVGSGGPCKYGSGQGWPGGAGMAIVFWWE